MKFWRLLYTYMYILYTRRVHASRAFLNIIIYMCRHVDNFFVFGFWHFVFEMLNIYKFWKCICQHVDTFLLLLKFWTFMSRHFLLLKFCFWKFENLWGDMLILLCVWKFMSRHVQLRKSLFSKICGNGFSDPRHFLSI